jgi:opacity protein-like surface antigen
MRVLVVFVVFALSSLVASAQYYDKLYFIDWNLNQPLTNTDFVGNTSTRGGRVGFRQFINENIGVGVDINWAGYDDYIERQTYASTNGALTTDFFKYVESYAGTVVTDYYFLTDSKLMPYAGLGLGAGYNNYKLYYNVFSSSEGSWGFVVRPQAGAWLRFGERSTWALHAGVHYGFSTSHNKELDYKNFSNVGFQIGLVKLDW